MTQTYRTIDGARWGSGKGSDLTAAEVDINFWDIIQRLLTIEALPSAAAGIDHFTTSGTQFYVVMTDATTLGPYDLPQTDFRDRGTWTASTAYLVNDTFTVNGGLYRVLYAHTSGLTFSAGANDGLGHDYYKLWIQTPGSSLPAGGATGQVMQKASSTDYAVTWGWKFPTGGTARKYLIQVNSTQDNAAWSTPQADDIQFTPVTGSVLISLNVADALEELSDTLDGSTVALSDLTDVQFPTGDPVLGSMLYYDDSLVRWTSSSEPNFGSLLYFDGSGWVPTADPTNGDYLHYNGTAWEGIALSLAFSQITGSLSVNQHRNSQVSTLGTSGTVSLDPSLGDVFTITPSNNVTLNAASTPAGAEITLIVTTSGTSSFNITPNTNFKSQGVLATGTVSAKTFAIKFVGTGSSLVEVSRTTAM